MSIQVDKNIRIAIPGEEGQHIGHTVVPLVLTSDKSIKAIYCVDDNKIISHLFYKSKGWTVDKAQEWINKSGNYKGFNATAITTAGGGHLDVIAKREEGYHVYQTSSDSFTMTKDIEKFTMGLKETVVIRREVESLKFDKKKQIVYGVFLVPEKADHDGDVISIDGVEKVAHGFITDFRTIDEMHEDIINAEIVESSIAWKDDLDFYGKKLKKGTWFGAIKINDNEVWGRVESGELKAFSVRISGVREPIDKED